jgi:hypothetical protein
MTNISTFYFLFPILLLFFIPKIFSNSHKDCKRPSLQDWETQLKPWKPVIEKHDARVLKSIFKNLNLYTYYNSTNNRIAIALRYNTDCSISSLLNYYHAKNCCEIELFEFPIESANQLYYLYVIRPFNKNFIFKKIVIDKISMKEIMFDSSEELFRDYENQKLLLLFS